MPGGPNRPPEVEAPPPPPPVAGTVQERLLRRLAPCRIALSLDLWRGAPSPELTKPFESAEAAFASGDFPHAESALDQLAVRFAEPRWPTLPEPFRRLRQEIVAPVPPHWDPEHQLPAPEKEGRKIHRWAELQLALAGASEAWAKAHQVPVDDLGPALEEARRRFAAEGGSQGFWSSIDVVWTGLRERVPAPGTKKTAAAPA